MCAADKGRSQREVPTWVVAGSARAQGAVGVLGGGWVPLPNADSSRAVNRDIAQHRALTRKIIVNIDFLNRKIYRLNTAVDGRGEGGGGVGESIAPGCELAHTRRG